MFGKINIPLHCVQEEDYNKYTEKYIKIFKELSDIRLWWMKARQISNGKN